MIVPVCNGSLQKLLFDLVYFFLIDGDYSLSPHSNHRSVMQILKHSFGIKHILTFPILEIKYDLVIDSWLLVVLGLAGLKLIFVS
jgi:hypothetical protein